MLGFVTPCLLFLIQARRRMVKLRLARVFVLTFGSARRAGWRSIVSSGRLSNDGSEHTQARAPYERDIRAHFRHPTWSEATANLFANVSTTSSAAAAPQRAPYTSTLLYLVKAVEKRRYCG